LVLALPLFVAVFFSGWGRVPSALAQEENPPTERYTWTPPTYGTGIHHYVVEMQVNEKDVVVLDPVEVPALVIEVHRGPVEDAKVLHYGNKYKFRVAGVDSADVQGPFSVWSEPFSPELGPPRIGK